MVPLKIFHITVMSLCIFQINLLQYLKTKQNKKLEKQRAKEGIVSTPRPQMEMG